MDSTVLYAEGRDGGPVTQRDEETASPYNTYLHKGLPPTPTCFPSPAALAAAISPPPGSWLYFVVVEANGTKRSPTPTPSSRPTRSWPNSAVSERRRSGTPGPVGRHDRGGCRRGPVQHSLSPLLHNTAFAELGVDWVSVGFPVPAGEATGCPGRHAGPRDPWPLGHHAPQGGGRGIGRPAERTGRAAAVGELRDQRRWGALR